jgi:4-hydroxy-tetrahydrodipicolinate synthase
MTALVTPMRNGTVDHEALAALVEAQIAGGIDGLIPCGTTGEAATLSADEHHAVIRTVVQAAKKRVPVIAGAGSNSTAVALQLGKSARDAGADALLVVVPYYNKPTQEGMYQHFRAVTEAGLPIVVYNVPGRTSADLSTDTLVRLCELPAIVAVKEATGSVPRTQEIVRRIGDRIVVLSGDDPINYPLYAVGARGCISVVSNVAPALIAECWDAVAAGDHTRARAAHLRSLPLAEALFFEPNPIPAKTALAMMGKMDAELRLPMTPMSAGPRDKLRAVLVEMGLL